MVRGAELHVFGCLYIRPAFQYCQVSSFADFSTSEEIKRLGLIFKDRVFLPNAVHLINCSREYLPPKRNVRKTLYNYLRCPPNIPCSSDSEQDSRAHYAETKPGEITRREMRYENATYMNLIS